MKSLEVENIHKVKKTVWKRWCPVARITFNSLYADMTQNQALFTHPKAKRISEKEWQTIAWNVAFWAASIIEET